MKCERCNQDDVMYAADDFVTAHDDWYVCWPCANVLSAKGWACRRLLANPRPLV